MKKDRIQHWFNFFKPRKEQPVPSIDPPIPIIEEPDLPLNKFGQPELLVDQCENRTVNVAQQNAKLIMTFVMNQ